MLFDEEQDFCSPFAEQQLLFFFFFFLPLSLSFITMFVPFTAAIAVLAIEPTNVVRAMATNTFFILIFFIKLQINLKLQVLKALL